MNLSELAADLRAGHSIAYHAETPPNIRTALNRFIQRPGDFLKVDKPQTINMDAMINNGVDCSFATDDGFQIHGTLTGKFGSLYVCENGNGYMQCRPRLYHWYVFVNDHVPSMPGGLTYEVMHRDGRITVGTEYDIASAIGFCVTGLRDGFCWSWDA